MDHLNSIRRWLRPDARVLGLVSVATCLLLTGCAEPVPRSFNDFMEDQIAREGVLVRCDMAGKEMQNDIECANARRAEATIALRLERERSEMLERESERRIQELSERIVERERLAREAAREAVLAEREAYEALWRERLLGSEAAGSVRAGSPSGADQGPAALTGDSVEANGLPAAGTLPDTAATADLPQPVPDASVDPLQEFSAELD